MIEVIIGIALLLLLALFVCVLMRIKKVEDFRIGRGTGGWGQRGNWGRGPYYGPWGRRGWAYPYSPTYWVNVDYSPSQASQACKDCTKEKCPKDCGESGSNESCGKCLKDNCSGSCQ